MVRQPPAADPPDSVPIVERFVSCTDGDLYYTNGPDTIVEDVIQLIIVGGVNERPAVLLAIGVEAVHSTASLSLG